MPTFSFPIVPENLTVLLRHHWNAPLPPYLRMIHSFGTELYARLFSTHSRSTSELLRTL